MSRSAPQRDDPPPPMGQTSASCSQNPTGLCRARAVGMLTRVPLSLRVLLNPLSHSERPSQRPLTGIPAVERRVAVASGYANPFSPGVLGRRVECAPRCLPVGSWTGPGQVGPCRQVGWILCVEFCAVAGFGSGSVDMNNTRAIASGGRSPSATRWPGAGLQALMQRRDRHGAAGDVLRVSASRPDLQLAVVGARPGRHAALVGSAIERA